MVRSVLKRVCAWEGHGLYGGPRRRLRHVGLRGNRKLLSASLLRTRYMVKVLAIGHARSGIGWEHIALYVGEEARRVWELYESDRVRVLSARGRPTPGVVLVFECDDVTEAERLVATLPMVEAGLLNFEVIPLRPYTGLREQLESPT